MPLRPSDGGTAVALSLRGLTVRSGGRTILQDITLSLPRGQRLAVLGPAGAGKTALLLAIAGLLRAQQGSVLTDGRDVTRLRATARGIGVALVTPPSGPFAALRARRIAPAGGHGLVLLDRPETWPETGATVVAAFADQALALSGANRLAVLREGRVVQEGEVAAVYENPRTAFVARFLGGANIIQGVVREVRPGGFVLAADGLRCQFTVVPDAPRPALGAKLTVALRPERIGLLRDGEAADNTASGVVAATSFHGASVLLAVDAGARRLDVRLAGWRAAQAPAPGSAVRLGWAGDAAVPVGEDGAED
jgi:ABC-type Fe3+/spermidine/putrescine transport system ATPase subunit